MKQRQEILASILTSKFGTGKHFPNSVNISDLSRAGIVNEVTRTYRKLGGILEEAPLSFGKWDICLTDFIVELDEEQHFNRYRATTFNSFIYHMEKCFEVAEYMDYCSKFELNCIKKSSWGKYWTSPSTERQFGNPGINADLEEDGSPRWRQRAFYDYLRDVFAIVYRMPVIRVSIYDRIAFNRKLKSVESILSSGDEAGLNEIAKFIVQKVNLVI